MAVASLEIFVFRPPTAPLELFFRGAMGGWGSCHPNDSTRIKRMGNVGHMQSYALNTTLSW